jgi:hypothetical protein
MLLGLFVFAIASTVEERPLLVFHGNAALTEEIYDAVLDLGPRTTATTTVANSVRLRLLEFLHRAGYDLAAVRTQVQGDQILVDINEGRLDKIIFLNEDAFNQIRLRLAFSLPQNVFNRLILERQLKEMSAQFGITSYRWLLVPTQRPTHIGPQIEKLSPIANFELIPPESGYELHIELTRTEWEPGVGLDASITGLEGVGIGGHFRDRALLLEEDRWEANGRVAVNLRETLDNPTSKLVLSAALAEARWYTPPLVGQYFRTYLDAQIYFLNRQRADIGLEAFSYLPISGSFHAAFTFVPGLALSIGAGIEYWHIFGIERRNGIGAFGPSPIVDSTPTHDSRVFGALQLSLTFNPDEIRRDRKHLFELEPRFYQRTDSHDSLRRIVGGYQKPFLFGWHELWIRARGALIFGLVYYPDEEPMGGDYLRGPFSGAFYLRKVASASVELRLSLVRDLFKISVYHDFATFGAQSADRSIETLQAANAFGLGLHILIIDAFQLDSYFGVGFSTVAPLPDGTTFDKGFVLSIKQAY